MSNEKGTNSSWLKITVKKPQRFTKYFLGFKKSVIVPFTGTDIVKKNPSLKYCCRIRNLYTKVFAMHFSVLIKSLYLIWLSQLVLANSSTYQAGVTMTWKFVKWSNVFCKTAKKHISDTISLIVL